MRKVLDLIRGALMGAAEVVPGVSGGTIALIVGIYRTLIDQAAHLVRALPILLREGPKGAWRQISTARWDILVPVGIGMLSAVLVGARVLEPLIEDHPVPTRAAFMGLVLAGLYVPYSMLKQTGIPPWRPLDFALIAGGALTAFLVTGVPPTEVDNPPAWAILLGASIAICALVLPGLSGSFLLLAMGLYGATLEAVNSRDLGYLAVFATGMVLGLGTFVLVLQWLLDHRARVTLALLTGVMAGSLRALWPWQGENREILAPAGQVGPVVLSFAAGFAAVAVLLLIEKRIRHRLADEPTDPEHLAHGG